MQSAESVTSLQSLAVLAAFLLNQAQFGLISSAMLSEVLVTQQEEATRLHQPKKVVSSAGNCVFLPLEKN